MPAQRQGGKKGRKVGRNKKKPSNMRYKAQDRLRKRKVKNIMENTPGLTKVEAQQQWDSNL